LYQELIDEKRQNTTRCGQKIFSHKVKKEITLRDLNQNKTALNLIECVFTVVLFAAYNF
jgi:hypothetical protein